MRVCVGVAHKHGRTRLTVMVRVWGRARVPVRVRVKYGIGAPGLGTGLGSAPAPSILLLYLYYDYYNQTQVVLRQLLPALFAAYPILSPALDEQAHDKLASALLDDVARELAHVSPRPDA